MALKDMRIVIAGGTGLLGQALSTRLRDQGASVIVLSRKGGTNRAGYSEVPWNPDGSSGPWARNVDGADAIVNLAGESIAGKRWTAARKRLLRSSRLDSTRSLVAAVGEVERPPSVFIQGSAVGYYGSNLDDRTVDENSPPGQDFLGRLAVEWEDASLPVQAHGCRRVMVRTGLVLSRHGGALPPMARPFRFFVGGPVGSGRQYLSWITIDDWVSLVIHALQTEEARGALNATAPEPVPGVRFSAALGRALGRPSWLPAPAFALRVLFGEMADALLLGGQRVVPARARSLRFTFEHRTIDEALAHVLRS